MTPRSPDRRVRRTKRLLKEALADLIHERGYDRVTVQDIVDRADVGRSTFYAHFESKEDLLLAGTDRYLLSLTQLTPKGVSVERDATRFRFSLELLRHVRLQRHFFQATILGGSHARLREISGQILTDVVKRELDRLAPDYGTGQAAIPGASTAEARAGLARAIVGTFFGVMEWWFRSADHLPPETVDEVFHHAAFGRLSTLVESG